MKALKSLLLFTAACVFSSACFAAEPTFLNVFTNGQDGYPAYRIPSLVVTKGGKLLAFTEARASLRDHAENDLVLKRSTNGGQTWGALQLVAEDGTMAAKLGHSFTKIPRSSNRNVRPASCAIPLPDGSVGCLFERDGYKTICFARFTLDWLTGN